MYSDRLVWVSVSVSAEGSEAAAASGEEAGGQTSGEAPGDSDQ